MGWQNALIALALSAAFTVPAAADTERQTAEALAARIRLSEDAINVAARLRDEPVLIREAQILRQAAPALASSDPFHNCSASASTLADLAEDLVQAPISADSYIAARKGYELWSFLMPLCEKSLGQARPRRLSLNLN